jgi:hypothetical protein
MAPGFQILGVSGAVKAGFPGSWPVPGSGLIQGPANQREVLRIYGREDFVPERLFLGLVTFEHLFGNRDFPHPMGDLINWIVVRFPV